MTEPTQSSDAGIMQLLRDATVDHHRSAEAHPFQRAFVKGRISQELYGTWLGQMRAVHVSLEHALDTLVSERAELAEVFTADRKKVALIEDDLAYLSRSTATQATRAATQALVRDIERWADSDPIALLGVLYVLEGSTNGSRFIARRLRQSYGWQDGRGCRYLDPYGERQGEIWAEFKSAMNRVRLNPAESNFIVAAARGTFDAVIALSEELGASLESRSAAEPV